MKKRCLFYMGFFLLATSAFAQKIDPKKIKKGDYIQVPKYKTKKFEGTWLYTNDTDTFKLVIYLKKKVYIKPVGVYIDHLNGKYLYKKDAIVITNTTDSTNTIGRDFISGGAVDREDNSILHASFRDPIKTPNHGRVTMKLLNKNELEWTLLSQTGPQIFSIPKNMILRRVK